MTTQPPAPTAPSAAATLIDRLRGIYTVPVNDGAGLLNGKDTFTRHFAAPPIQHEAADALAALAATVRELVGSLQAFERLSDLWLPKIVGKERLGEAHALHSARERMLSALSRVPADLREAPAEKGAPQG